MSMQNNDANGSTPTGGSNGSPRVPREVSATPRTNPRSAGRSWLWTFIGIAFISIVLLGWLALFISQQSERQLTLEQLMAARKVWDAKGSKDYKMLYFVQRSNTSKDEFYVEVRGGKVQSVLFNNGEHLPPEKLVYHTMSALLDDIEVFLKLDAQPGSTKAQNRASFASDDGHLLWFNRRFPGGGVDIRVEEFRPMAGK